VTEPTPDAAESRPRPDLREADRPVLVAEGVSTTVGGFTLHPVDLRVRAGETVCLLGANGAGKTTLLRCLLALLPHSGVVRIDGRRASRRETAWLADVGVVPDDMDELIDELTAEEHWELHAALLTADGQRRASLLCRARSLARELQLHPEPGLLTAGFSHGMRKKTQLVTALMHAPQLLILDEPRNGLDPAGIAVMERLQCRHCAAGGAILAASHDLRWVERIADRVVILSQGRVAAVGAPADLRRAGEDFVDAFFRLTESEPSVSVP